MELGAAVTVIMATRLSKLLEQFHPQGAHQLTTRPQSFLSPPLNVSLVPLSVSVSALEPGGPLTGV